MFEMETSNGMKSSFFLEKGSNLLKQNLADTLLQHILNGQLAPGDRIVEADWARRLGVSQGSIREAINILVGHGFIEKGQGRTARVIKLTHSDFQPLYAFRAAIEAAAARLIVENRADLSRLHEALANCEEMVSSPDVANVIESVLRFHLTLCECSGNVHILNTFRRLFVPMYAFTLIRAISTGVGTTPWAEVLPMHKRIVEALESGDAFFAEQYVRSVIVSFAKDRRHVWPQDEEEKLAVRRPRGRPRKQVSDLETVNVSVTGRLR